MSQFSEFMKDSENNEDMKAALDSVVSEIIKKDTLYEPMKKLKDEYPAWLENNWEKLSQEDLEKYNKQMDKINEICKLYEDEQAAAGAQQDQGTIFELLSQLQELGTPPEDLMKKVADGTFGQDNPFNKIWLVY